MSEINKIYEIVDRTNDEIYFTLGIFLSLEEAIINVESTMPDEWGTDGCIDDYATIEIRERNIGWTGSVSNVVLSIEWENQYQEDTDENKWIIFKRNNETVTSSEVLKSES